MDSKWCASFWLVLATLAAAGCSDDGGDGGGGDAQADAGGDAGGGDTGGGDTGTPDSGGGDAVADSAGDSGGFVFPATATMQAGIGGTLATALLCELMQLGGGTEITLVPGGASPCTGGEVLLTFGFDSANSDYSAFDNVLTASHGDLVAGTVTGLPEDTVITVTTDRLEVDFSFSGTDVTVDSVTDNGM